MQIDDCGMSKAMEQPGAAPAESHRITPAGRPGTSPGNSKLREACAEFEGMLLGIILKQGLKGGSLDADQQAGNDILTDFSAEQAARQMGQAGTFGIGRLLYEQITGGGE